MTRKKKQRKKSVQDAQRPGKGRWDTHCAICTKKEDKLYEQEMAHNAPHCFYGSFPWNDRSFRRGRNRSSTERSHNRRSG